jgi:pyruvate dehydrogenase E2 component (dihydrolipoamide acetyltransferase)
MRVSHRDGRISREAAIDSKTDAYNRVINREIPYVGVRKVIGVKMKTSLDSCPQASSMARFDMSQIVRIREEFKIRNTPVSYTDIMVKVIAAAVPKLPLINSVLADGVITIFKTINMGVAVKAEDLLVVPVINNIGSKSILQISEETQTAIKNAREKRFDEINMTGGTFTFNNLGMYYIEGCHPIVNYPETAQVAMGRISKEAWVDERDNLVVRPICTLSIVINHAVLDGGQAGEFLGYLKEVIDSPQDYLS